MKIDAIRIGATAIYIQSGKREIEVPGGVAQLGLWADSSPDLIALAVSQHLKTDPTLLNVTPLTGKTLSVSVKAT